MKLKRFAYIFAWVCATCTFTVSRAQIDAPLTPGFDFGMLINPAACGLDAEVHSPFFEDAASHKYSHLQHSIALNYKNQLKGAFSSKSLRILSANYQCRFARERMALGVSVYSNTLNKQAMRDFQIMVNYAYHWAFVEDEAGDPLHRLSFGLQVGYRNYGYQTGNIQTGEMYDPHYTHGINFAMSPTDELPDTRNLFDGHAGVVYMGRFGERVRLEAGFSLFHLFRPKTGALEGENLRIPLRFSAHAQAVVGMGENSQLLVGAYYNYQSDKLSGNHIASTFLAQVGYRYVFDPTFSLGCSLAYRTKCALIPQISLDIAGFSLYLQMEANVNYSYNNLFSIGLGYRF